MRWLTCTWERAAECLACDLNLFALVLNYPARWPWGTRLGREFAVGSRRANDDRLPAVACIFILFYSYFSVLLAANSLRLDDLACHKGTFPAFTLLGVVKFHVVTTPLYRSKACLGVRG